MTPPMMPDSPCDLLNISPGQNCFNVGIGRAAAHTDYTLTQVAAGYSSVPEFQVTPDGTAVQFRVSTAGKTTSSGTKYPRVELRQANPDGSLASWDGRGAGATFEGVSIVRHLPPNKPWACVTQWHDARSDLARLQIEGSSLSALKLVCRNTPPGSSKETVKTVRAGYTLGDRIDWRWEIAYGVGRLLLDGVVVQTFPADESGLYAKCGLYLQTNATIDSASEYGIVEILRGSLRCVAGIVAPPGPVPSSGPVIMIIRHGEKDDNADGKDDVAHGLSAKGRKRALAIRDRGLFITPRVDLAIPTYIFASGPAPTRMVETAKPTADALHLPIDASLDSENAVTQTAQLLAVQALAGKVVLGVLEHSCIAAVASALVKTLGGHWSGKPPSSWSDSDFSTIWLFRGDGKGNWSFVQTDEGVLPGDPGFAAPPVSGPKFPESRWWAKYAPRGTAVAAACAAAVAVVLASFGVDCGADCPSTGNPPVTSVPATTTPPVTSVPTTSAPPGPGRVYPWHTDIVSTTFWVGEIFDASLPDGSQVCSTYDSQWAYHWGGVKAGVAGSGTDCAGSPTGSCDGVPGKNTCATEARRADNGYFPTSSKVTPKENPFYLDLPFDDINDSTGFKTRCTVIPWAKDDPSHCGDAKNSYMKNRWVRLVGPNGSTCYGQIEDAGPSSGSAYHDAAYVFGSDDARPANKKFGAAGADVSPALNGCLGFKELDGDGDKVSWQFVDAVDVPAGPWTKVVTTSGFTP